MNRRGKRQWSSVCSLVSLSILGLWIPQRASGQEAACTVDGVQFDYGETTQINGTETLLLINARLCQEGTLLLADRMRQETDSIYFFTGNVRIIEERDTIYADVVRYDEKTKIGLASGNVLMSDGAVRLRSVSTRYYSEEKRSEFDSGVEYTDSLTVLKSDTGTYWSDEAVAEFSGHVELRQLDLYLEADSIHYGRETEIMQATGNVVVERLKEVADSLDIDPEEWLDSSRNIIGFSSSEDRSLLFSDRAFYDGTVDSSRVSGDVFLLRLQADSTATDTLMVEAGTMIITRDLSGDRVIAIDSVSVVESGFSLVGDSLVYVRTNDGITEHMNSRMYGGPKAWVSDSQVTSDSLQIWGSHGAVDSLRATGTVFVASMDSALARIQQVKGRMMVAYFAQDSLRTMVVNPNAEALYYIEPNPGDSVVAVRTSADWIELSFEHGDVTDVRVVKGIEGTLYPEDLVDQVENLSGYIWEPERRPDRNRKQQELNRRIGLQAARPGTNAQFPGGNRVIGEND